MDSRAEKMLFTWYGVSIAKKGIQTLHPMTVYGVQNGAMFFEKMDSVPTEKGRSRMTNRPLSIIEINPGIREAVKASGGYCSCAVEKEPDTMCICKAFREQDKPGECHCGRFAKIDSEDPDVPTSGERGDGE